MDPNPDTENVPVPPEYSDGAKEVPQEPQPLRRAQDQNAQQAQPAQIPQPVVGQPNIDIEALKREAAARREQNSNKAEVQEEYKSLFSKRYFLAVGILLSISAVVFGMIIFLHLTRG